jgi:hypothetical protein
MEGYLRSETGSEAFFLDVGAGLWITIIEVFTKVRMGKNRWNEEKFHNLRQIFS